MRRLERIAIVAVVSCVAGCSGLQTSTTSGGGNTGGGGSQSVTISITPTSATLAPFGTAAFSASVSGTSNTAVTWQVNGVAGGTTKTGLISSGGIYAAPYSIDPSLVASDSNSVTLTVTAVSQANSTAMASATVTLVTQQRNAQTGAIELGTSGGNVSDLNGKYCCGGTLGSLVSRNGTYYILSNNHVLAKSDSGIVGDAITQPGIIDATSPCTTDGVTTVAHLSEFFNLETGPLPKVDAALAQIVSGQVDTSGKILLLAATETEGVPDADAPQGGSGVAPTIGAAVAKSGRTTGLTCSTILGTNVAANVSYYRHCGDTTAAFTTNYTDLLTVAGEGFSGSGDSGSLIVTQSTADPVGLLFAGSDTDSVASTMQDVLAAFPGTGNALPTIVGGAAHQVVGCSLTLTQAATAGAQPQVSDEALRNAVTVRDAQAAGLLSNSAVQAIGVGSSYDSPGEAAILVFVGSGAQAAAGQIPAVLGGVRTRVVENNGGTRQGTLTREETAAAVAKMAEPQLVYALSGAEMQRGVAIHAKNKEALLKLPDVLGVGVTSSVDAPGEAALLIYVQRGTSKEQIPQEVDGMRTRIRETSPFVAGRDGSGPAKACGATPKAAIRFSK